MVSYHNKVHEFPLSKTDCNNICLCFVYTIYYRRVPCVVIYLQCFGGVYISYSVMTNHYMSHSLLLLSYNKGSNFVISQRPQVQQQQPVSRSNSKSSLQMGSQAKFGVFSPAVYVAKIGLGNDKLNKIRGKAISLHSQYIGEFCTWSGAYHLRTRLIKKAKLNGDILGFLV